MKPCALARLGGLVIATVASLSCALPSGPEAPRERGEALFAKDVYPVLLRDCGFPACHGGHTRFFQVFGPGRVRLDEGSLPYDPPTPDEIEFTRGRATSMLTRIQGIADPPLLRKPLATEAGGGEHRGFDLWGENVYHSKGAAGYAALSRWASSAAGDDAEGSGR